MIVPLKTSVEFQGYENMTPRRIHLTLCGITGVNMTPSRSHQRQNLVVAGVGQIHPSDGTWCWTRFDKMGVDVRQVGSHQHKVIDSDRKSFYSLIWPCGKTCVYLFQFCKLYQNYVNSNQFI